MRQPIDRVERRRTGIERGQHRQESFPRQHRAPIERYGTAALEYESSRELPTSNSRLPTMNADLLGVGPLGSWELTRVVSGFSHPLDDLPLIVTATQDVRSSLPRCAPGCCNDR